jgi:hypothetical protein
MANKPKTGAVRLKSVEPAQAANFHDEIENAEVISQAIITCGKRGLSLHIVEEQTNVLGHLLELTRAVSGIHRAIELAQRAEPCVNWFESDLNAALAGAELISNLAVEYAMLIPE